MVLAVAVLAASCSSLPDLKAGVCGNLTLDPGEACDDTTDNCQHCELVCGQAQPGEPCASGFGYVCGVDGTCHAPSGMFARATSELGLSPIDVAITDVDGDHVNDILALTGTSISVTFGDASGFLTREQRSVVPPFSGAPAFGNLDDDGHTDVLLSTPDGIAGFSSAHRVIAPHPFAIDLGTTTPTSCLTGQPFRVFSISSQYLGVLIDVAGRIDLAVIDSAGKDACPVQQVPLCTVGAVDPRTFPSDVYDISAGSFVSHVLALATPVGACVATITKAAAGPAPFTLSPQVIGSFPSAARPVLVQLEATGCPSLVYSTTSTHLEEYLAVGTAPACGFSGTTTGITLAGPTIPIGASAIGHVRLVPAIGAPGDPVDAVALSTGIYAVAKSRMSATELYKSDRPLAYVQAADLDADGDLDVAAIGGDVKAGTGADGIDALYRTGGASFLRVRTATRGLVEQLAVGDFDGNEADDIAYTERVLDSDRLSVLYGTRDRLLDPVEAGAFSHAVGLCPMQATDSADPNELIDDLTIIDLPSFTTPPLFTVLHGSPQRTMLSFYDPRVRAFGVPPSSAFTGVAFANLDRNSARVDDVLAIETGAADSKIWPASNTAAGLTFPTATRLDGVRECSTGTAGFFGFCTAGAHYVAWPLIDHDVMIGIAEHGPARTITLDPAAFSGTYTPLVSDKLDGFEGLTVKSAYAVAFDDPREHTLVVSLAGGAGFQPMVVVCTADERGVLTGCTDVVRAAGMADDAVCIDAAPAAVSPRVINDLVNGQQVVMLCRWEGQNRLWALRTIDGNYTVDPLTVVDDFTRIQLQSAVALRAGDVTGDGIDDVLALTAGQSNRTVLVIPQCASTDLACQGIDRVPR